LTSIRLTPTKIWPPELFPAAAGWQDGPEQEPGELLSPEVEADRVSAPGVLVDGLDFSDDKLLQGRTFSYSDTQRYRVGPNYPATADQTRPKSGVSTNQRDGQMTYHVGHSGKPARQPTSRPAGGGPPGSGARPARPTRADGDWQGGAPGDQPDQQLRARLATATAPSSRGRRDELISNLVGQLKQCNKDIQERMVWHPRPVRRPSTASG